MKKVLIVEDDLILLMVHRKFLEKLGCIIVDKVTSGEAAVASAKINDFDFILMDVHIHGDMDGIEAVTKIQKEKNIPVIYVTGNSDPAIFERAKKTNMKGFLVKPFHIEDLKKLLGL